MLASKDVEVEWITKPDRYICCLQETHIRSKDKNRQKVNGWKNIFYEIEIKKADVAIIIPAKIDFKTKAT